MDMIIDFQNSNVWYYIYIFFILLCMGILVIINFKVLNKKHSFSTKKIFIEEVSANEKIYRIIERINCIKTISRFGKNKKIQDIERKLEILRLKFENVVLTLDGFFNLLLLGALLAAFLLNAILQWNLLVILFLNILLIVLGMIYFIENSYLNKQKRFERKISEVGLIIKQMVALNKGIFVILKNLSETKDTIISEEFTEIYNEYNNTNSIKKALHKINDRYPDSLYLKTIKELLLIYVEHQRNIMNEIDTLIKEIESFERIKKKIEVEFAKQDKTIAFLIIFSLIAVLFFISMNDLFKVFYASKIGLSIALGTTIYIGVGLFIIQIFKIEIIKERKARRIDQKGK